MGLHHSYQDKHNWLFLRRNIGICGPKVKHAGAWLVELHFIRAPGKSQLSSVAHWGVGSNLSLFFLQGRQAAYGVLPVAPTVNFHWLFYSFSSTGIGRAGSQPLPAMSL